MVSGMLPKKIDKTLECYLMCTSKWTLEASLWNTKKKQFLKSLKSTMRKKKFPECDSCAYESKM